MESWLFRFLLAAGVSLIMGLCAAALRDQVTIRTLKTEEEITIE